MGEGLSDPKHPQKGRGAVSNAASARFTAQQREPADDGWDTLDAELAERADTVVGTDASRSILTRNQSPDVPFDRSINPYKGCEHGCVYCFARPTHAYLDLSPGLDFETRIFAKPNAAELLRTALNKRGYTPDVVTLGANTDPYQPVERRLRITRAVLEVLAEANHPLCIVTKGAGVARDADILGEMGRKKLARVMISVTTLDRELARKLEPRASTPARRLDAMARLTDAGAATGVLAAPMIPAVNDHELEGILAAAAKTGAQSAGYVLLRLPHEIKNLFAEWLDAHYPDRKDRVLNRVRANRDGALNDATWRQRLTGTGEYAELLAKRFELACTRHGLNTQRWDLDTTQFRSPERDGRQGRLF
jgi:DNA repair photolyase